MRRESALFTFNPASFAATLVIPLGMILVAWIGLRNYFETRKIGFLSIALAFLVMQTATLLINLIVMSALAFEAIILVSTVPWILFCALIGFGLWKLSPSHQKQDQPSPQKLTIPRQLSLLAGVATLVAAFSPWIRYEYRFATANRGGSFFLFDLPLAPTTHQLEQIDITTLTIGAALAFALLLAGSIGCIIKEEGWSILSLAGVGAFFITYVRTPGTNLMIATGGTSTLISGLNMALTTGPILAGIGAAVGLIALTLPIIGLPRAKEETAPQETAPDKTAPQKTPPATKLSGT